MTKVEAIQLVGVLAELYDLPAWTEGRVQLFADAILDLDYARACKAVVEWTRTKSQRPQPADIRRTVVESAIDLPEPEEAYGMVHARFASHGPTDLPDAIMEAVELTGKSWEDLAYMQYDQYPWFRRDFLNAYREVRDRYLTTAQQDPTALPSGKDHRAVSRDEARELLRAITKGNA